MFLPALAALMMQGNLPAEVAAFSTASLARDSATLAGAISGRRLEFAMRGAGMAVHADARPTAGGCATIIAASAPGVAGRWSRMLRWSDLAWTGALPDGRVLVAFYAQEGRLPGDRLAFAPSDPDTFRAAVTRVSETCRSARAQSERISSGDYGGSRSCYFARLPGLELIEAAQPTGEPSRAVLTVLAQETPEAELRLIVERPAEGGAGGWGQPEVTFTIASPTFKSLRIAEARFALDGVSADPHHSLALYNDTRLRIRMDPRSALRADGDESFYRRLAASRSVTVTLLDGEGHSRAELTFDAGRAFTAAHAALDGASWSCAASKPAFEPATDWHLAG